MGRKRLKAKIGDESQNRVTEVAEDIDQQNEGMRKKAEIKG